MKIRKTGSINIKKFENHKNIDLCGLQNWVKLSGREKRKNVVLPHKKGYCTSPLDKKMLHFSRETNRLCRLSPTD
jgi:hypothetical protein